MVDSKTMYAILGRAGLALSGDDIQQLRCALFRAGSKKTQQKESGFYNFIVNRTGEAGREAGQILSLRSLLRAGDVLWVS